MIHFFSRNFKMSSKDFLALQYVYFSKESFLFLLLLIYFGYANCNTQEAFAIIFFIYTNLLNCLVVCTVMISMKNGYNESKSSPPRKLSLQAAIFCYFDVLSIRPPQKFQAQGRISTIRPVFLVYLSVSYD